MNAAGIRAIKLGDLGLYQWGPKQPCIYAGPVQKVLFGRRKGLLFRTVNVASSTGNATISFIVEQDEGPIEQPRDTTEADYCAEGLGEF